MLANFLSNPKGFLHARILVILVKILACKNELNWMKYLFKLTSTTNKFLANRYLVS